MPLVKIVVFSTPLPAIYSLADCNEFSFDLRNMMLVTKYVLAMGRLAPSLLFSFHSFFFMDLNTMVLLSALPFF